MKTSQTMRITFIYYMVNYPRMIEFKNIGPALIGIMQSRVA